MGLPIIIILNALLAERTREQVQHSISMAAYKKSYHYPFPQSGLQGDLFAEAEVFHVTEDITPDKFENLLQVCVEVPVLRIAVWLADGVTQQHLTDALSGAADIRAAESLGDALRDLLLIAPQPAAEVAAE